MGPLLSHGEGERGLCFMIGFRSTSIAAPNRLSRFKVGV